MDAATKERLSGLVAARLDLPVKNQQRGEPDLTQAERQAVLMEILESKPAQFLERWGKELSLDDLEAFASVRDPNVTYQVNELRKRLDPAKRRQSVKNRRYLEMQRREKAGDYFSEDSMRARAPELYEEYVGQYLSQSEKNDIIQRDRDKAAAEGGPIQGRVLSDFFMRALEKEHDMDAAQYRQPMKTREESDIEEFDTDSEVEMDAADASNPSRSTEPKLIQGTDMESIDGDEFGTAEGVYPRPMPPSVHYDRFGIALSPPRISANGYSTEPTREQKDALKEEFARIMRERFLDGREEAVDYGAIDSCDENDEYNDEYRRDEEDRYFDEDD